MPKHESNVFPLSGTEEAADLSDWQDGGIKPVSEGPYLRAFDEGEAVSWFKGGEWTYDGFFSSDIQNAPWRGRCVRLALKGGA